VTFGVEGGFRSAELTVTQEMFMPEVAVDKGEVEFTWRGGEEKVAVSANMAWTVAEIPAGSWLRVKEVGAPEAGKFTIEADPNTDKDNARTYTLLVWAGEPGHANSESAEIKITQGAWQAILRAGTEEPMPLGVERKTFTVKVDSNVMWNAGSSDRGWLRITGTTRGELNSNGAINNTNAAENPAEREVETTVTVEVLENGGAPRSGWLTFSREGGGLTTIVTVHQSGADLAQRSKYTVYETRLTARTSTLRELKVNVRGALNANGTTYANQPRTITFRAPVSKGYTILMAYDNDAGGEYATKGIGRMWANRETVWRLAGENLRLGGRDANGDASFMGAKGLQIPESGYYRLVDGDGNETSTAVHFEGLATRDARVWRLASSLGTVYGENFRPFERDARGNDLGEQGRVKGDEGFGENGGIPGVYYPQAVLEDATAAAGSEEAAAAHFFGTYTTRLNAARTKDLADANLTDTAGFTALAERLMGPPAVPRNSVDGKWRLPQPPQAP